MVGDCSMCPLHPCCQVLYVTSHSTTVLQGRTDKLFPAKCHRRLFQAARAIRLLSASYNTKGAKKADRDSMQTNGHGHVPIKLYLSTMKFKFHANSHVIKHYSSLTLKKTFRHIKIILSLQVTLKQVAIYKLQSVQCFRNSEDTDGCSRHNPQESKVSNSFNAYGALPSVVLPCIIII